jgi:hypothetical protein
VKVVGILFRDAVAETIAVVSRLGAYGLLVALVAASAIVLLAAYRRRRGRPGVH